MQEQARSGMAQDGQWVSHERIGKQVVWGFGSWSPSGWAPAVPGEGAPARDQALSLWSGSIDPKGF